MRRADYVKSELAKKAETHLDKEPIVTEEDELFKLKDVLNTSFTPVDVAENRAQFVQITGNKERGKSTFALLMAQYIASTYRCILLETDYEYFSLSTYIRYSNIQFTEIPLEWIYDDPKHVIRAVNQSPHNLIIFTGTSALTTRHLSKVFVMKFIYNMFVQTINYIVLESGLDEMLPAVQTVMVINNDIVSILRDVARIPYNLDRVKFVALAKTTVVDTQIQSSEEITALMSQLLNTEIDSIPIYSITSTQLGKEVYDLGGLML
jgi:hypothetical protein